MQALDVVSTSQNRLDVGSALIAYDPTIDAGAFVCTVEVETANVHDVPALFVDPVHQVEDQVFDVALDFSAHLVFVPVHPVGSDGVGFTTAILIVGVGKRAKVVVDADAVSDGGRLNFCREFLQAFGDVFELDLTFVSLGFLGIFLGVKFLGFFKFLVVVHDLLKQVELIAIPPVLPLRLSLTVRESNDGMRGVPVRGRDNHAGRRLGTKHLLVLLVVFALNELFEADSEFGDRGIDLVLAGGGHHGGVSEVGAEEDFLLM